MNRTIYDLNLDALSKQDWQNLGSWVLNPNVLDVDDQRNLGKKGHYIEQEDGTIKEYTPLVNQPPLDKYEYPEGWISSQQEMDNEPTDKLIVRAYAYKQAIETYPGPDRRRTERIGLILHQLHTRGFDITGFESGMLIEEAREQNIFQ